MIYGCTEGPEEGKDGVRPGRWLNSFPGILAMSVSAAVLSARSSEFRVSLYTLMSP